MSATLQAVSLAAGHGPRILFSELDLVIAPGDVVGLVGVNGAGKSTLLKTAAGLIRPSTGTVRVAGQDVTNWPPHKRARTGLCLIPEGRGIFRRLTVRENLVLAIPPWAGHADLGPALTAFPALGPKLRQVSGSMSGGEQQMLAMARAYLAKPKIILVDELSLGLAPVIVTQIFESLKALVGSGVSLVIVDQYVHRVLELADYVYVLTRGAVTWSGAASALNEDELTASYLAVDEAHPRKHSANSDSSSDSQLPILR
jgi:branched-chain amino acid transport system ATP-binding protein